jgi:hypothetical protein
LQNTSEIDAATWCQFHQHVYERLYCTKDKKLLVFENKFHHAFLLENCDGCAVRKSHLAVLVASCKSQLPVYKKSFGKVTHKNVDEISTWWQKLATDLSILKTPLSCQVLYLKHTHTILK